MQRMNSSFRHTRPEYQRANVRGFTLVELVITLVVLAVVLAIGYPNLTMAINNSRVTGAANELVAALQVARMEAVRRNARVYVCRTDSATGGCAGSGVWNQWLVFADRDRNGALTAGEALRRGEAHTQVGIRASSNITAGSLVFGPDGFARNGATPAGNLLAARFGVCLPTNKPPTNERLVSIGSGSRISTGTSTNPSCASPSN